MKQLKSTKGVTLLEIMLVLAIAAMVIVMSIRYYQSATTSSQANAAISQIQAITAAADNLAIGAGSYSGIPTGALASTTGIGAILGAANLLSPTNGAISVTAVTTTTYSMSMTLNPAICESVKAKLAATAKITASACAAGVLTWTYNNTI